jgi:hypothetical protein
MYIRDELPNDKVKDLAHFVAHSTRDRGYAFTYTERFVQDMVEWLTNGGALHVAPIFVFEDVLRELCADLKPHGIALDAGKVNRNKVKLKAVLLDLLDGVSLKLNNPAVASCMFEKAHVDDSERLLFIVTTAKRLQGALTVPQNTPMAFEVFD